MRSFSLLYLAVFISIVGFGMVIPLLPFYAQSFGATNTQIGLLAASFSITQFLAAPFFGRISDRIGRKPILAISLAGSALSFLFFGLAESLFWLFILRALHGIFSAGALPIASAYIGDTTSKEERTKYMSKLAAIFALGFVFGPAFSGILSGNNLTLPFFVASIVSAANAIFIWLFLPESLTKKEKRIVLTEGLVNIKAMMVAFRGDFGIFFLLLFSWAFALSNLQLAFPLFSEEHFSFTARDNGYFFAFIGTVAAIVQWVILPKISRFFIDTKVIAIGILFAAIGQFLVPWAKTIFGLYMITAIYTSGSSLIRPVINSILSKETRGGQGTTMGLAFSFESLGRIAGPLLGGLLIGILDVRSQFILSSVVFFISLIVFTFSHHFRKVF